ncbi:MAG: metal-dependent transcriptional regulator [Bacteroidia bacterium]|nr:metal-dependent transcriptional regulator [Bacteroidia bacterium]
MYSYTEENYLKAIYKLQEKNNDAINTNSIARVMSTTAASVTDMIKKLSDKKLLEYQKYKGVQLTESGKKTAIETVRKHRLWETFLHNKLNFLWDEVHDIAEQLEHIQSQTLIDKLDEYLGFPTHDPHGDPIPERNGIIKTSNYVLLSDMTLEKEGIISGVVNHSSLFLQHLQKIELTLGRLVKVIEINAFDLSLSIQLDKDQKIQISNEVARNILMKTK